MASLGVGLDRLRQLGWDRSPHYTSAFARSLGLAGLMVAALLIYLPINADVGVPPASCIAAWVMAFVFMLMLVYRSRKLALRTGRSLTRRVTAPRGKELSKAVEAAMASVGFQHVWAVPQKGAPLSAEVVAATFHVCSLPQLSAELMVGADTDVRDGVEATTLLLGPVTAENVGGLVRLAEAIEHHASVESVIQRGS